MSEDEVQPQDVPLPFGEGKQEALLGYALINDNIFNQIKDLVKPCWFVGARCSQLYKALLAESALVKRRVSPQELMDSQTIIRAGQEEHERLRSAMNKCIAQTANFGLDGIVPELSDWLKARIYMEQVYKSRDLFNSARNAGDTPTARVRRTEAYEVLHEMARNIEKINFDNNGEVSFKNIQGSLVEYKLEYKNAMTFGSKVLDSLLLPEAQGGGCLLPGDMTVILGPQNAGKSCCMLTVMAANLKAGKNIMYIPHEGRISDLKLKLVQCIFGLTKEELFYHSQDSACAAGFEQAEQLLEDHLVYIPQIRAGLTVEELGSTVRRGIDRFAARHNGNKIDLLVDDYLARLTSVQNGRGQFQKRERDQVVYEYGSSLAGECKLHLLTGVQANRVGNEINRKVHGREDRLLVPEDVSESYGVAMVATNIISINRSPLAQARRRVTFLICKSRSSETHIAVVCGSDFSHATTHSDDLGCTYYHGISTMDERIDELMQQYKGVRIPDTMVLKADNE